MNQDLLRIIDSICRDKNIEREGFMNDLEGAMSMAVRKAFETEDAEVHLDPLTGHISATVQSKPVDMQTLGRIAAQTAKQVIIQRTRERERASIFEDFTERRGTIVTGQVTRVEGGNLLVNIGRTEGFLPRSEQIPGETHEVGDRLRVLILEVREQPNQVKIILSRSHPEFITRLFELEVPEVAERIIEIRALAREAGYRTKVAVSSIDSKVDAVGACVGVRGSRIKNIVEELGGEKIDIVRWNESSQILIQNALKPAEVQEIALCLELGKATVVVAEDQLSLAIGKRGQNVRLAARLTGWDIDILTPAEYNKNLELMEQSLRRVEGVDDVLLDKLVAIGCVSVADIDELGPDPLVTDLEIPKELADRIVEEAGEEVIRQEEEKEAAKRAAAEAAARGETLTPAVEETPSAFVATEAADAAATGTVEAANGTQAASGATEAAEQQEPVVKATEAPQTPSATDEAVPEADTIADEASAGEEAEKP
ncbi:MAG: transcription termination factor NusA [Phycisphaerae bacterium]|nr:transcription termination factor NusA [Phycisphaerae bacterium]MCZ2400262.1 transcription termination factor NusA [Phycisphaerae bacterium]